MSRPETTLFMLMSVDGKISTGSTDDRDVDKDFPNIPGLREGLSQYYDLEQQTDLWTLNTGRVLAKVGVNEGRVFQNGVPVTFVVVDSAPHLTETGTSYLAEKTAGLIVLTTNAQHPAIGLSKSESRIEAWLYERQIDFANAFRKLKAKDCARLTVQSGATFNAKLLRQGLIDHVSLVVAPALIGGINTQSLIGGPSISSSTDLQKIRVLKLISCEPLKNSYLHLCYDVLN